jgi:hypothetical protein
VPVLLLKIVLPVVAGTLAASVAVVGLVWSQTKAPDVNPAGEQVLTYGDRS